ncbi:hypothetical protein Lal_00016640, partial [Lupinus albus]
MFNDLVTYEDLSTLSFLDSISPHQPQESNIPNTKPENFSFLGLVRKHIENKTLKEFLSSSSDESEKEAHKPSSKYLYIWQFKRISSLNFDTTRKIRSKGFRNSPLFQVEGHQYHHHLSTAYYFYSSPLLKKNCGSSGNGVRISLILNIPQVYFPKNYCTIFWN